MNTIIKESFKKLIDDRYLLVLSIFTFVLAIVFIVIVLMSIKPSELQLVSHYSAFGVTHLYRDQWFYLYVFAAFQIITMLFHILISVKLLVIKGHSFAISFLWLGLGIMTIGLIIALSVINVWTPL